MTREQKIKEAQHLRAEGLTYQQIAEKLGYRSHKDAWHLVHPEKSQEITQRDNLRRKDAKREWNRANAERLRKRRRERRAENREQDAASARRHRQKNPEKARARGRIQQAIRRGAVVRPDHCERCGIKASVHAHHPDYSKAYEVDWLCASCHLREHGKVSA